MRALDGLQGPMYVGTGCLFRRYALYGFNPPRAHEYYGLYGQNKKPASSSPENVNVGVSKKDMEMLPLNEAELDAPKRFGSSKKFIDSIAVAEFHGRPLADHPSVKNGRPPGALLVPRQPLDATTVAEAVSVISCWYVLFLLFSSYIYFILLTTYDKHIAGTRTRRSGETVLGGSMVP
jgi:cellulose synthase-like protein